VTVLLAATAAVLCAAGAYLILGRQLSRIVVGVGLLGHGANLLLIMSAGRRGEPAFAGGDESRFLDPLPQALVLTAIVITFGVIAFLLALAYRSWLLTGQDDVEDDLEDLLISRRAARAAESEPRAGDVLAVVDDEPGIHHDRAADAEVLS
jgi:multicomponent Na+:H+ antiporter subunit C